MASRRSAAPGAPFYATGPRPRAIHDPNESAFTRFIREEVFSPEKFPGNLSIVTGLAVFFGGIAAVRTWGDIMLPA